MPDALEEKGSAELLWTGNLGSRTLSLNHIFGIPSYDSQMHMLPWLVQIGLPCTIGIFKFWRIVTTLLYVLSTPRDWCLVGVIGSQDWNPPVLVKHLRPPHSHWQQPTRAVFGLCHRFLAAHAVAAVLLEYSQLRSHSFISHRETVISMIPKKSGTVNPCGFTSIW